MNNYISGLCGCVPFKHYPFPKDPELRRRWKHLVNRQKSDKDKTLWSPKKGSVICSDHFKDGEPTNKNPCPTLHIGYKSFMPSLSLRKRKLSENTTALPLPTSEQSDNTEPETGSEVVNELIGQKSDQGEEPENWLAVDQLDCTIVENKVPKDNSTRIMRLKKEIRYWKKKSFSDCQQLRETKKQLEKHTKSLRQKLLQNDQKCEFYTGISSLAIYSALCEYTTSFMSANKAALPKRKSYYYTTKRRRFISPTPSKPTNDGLPKNLQHEDCILLTLMKLRLGLLHADLANR